MKKSKEAKASIMDPFAHLEGKSPAEQLQFMRSVGFRRFARRVFLDRNAGGAPPELREIVKRAARPNLRKAIRFARRARRASEAGDEQGYGSLIGEAIRELDAARSELRGRDKAAATLRDQRLTETAGNPRPGGRSPLRAKIVLLMKRYKADDVELKDFLAAWEREALDGLRVVLLNDAYQITDENGEESNSSSRRWPNEYTLGSLTTMYSKA